MKLLGSMETALSADGTQRKKRLLKSDPKPILDTMPSLASSLRS